MTAGYSNKVVGCGGWVTKKAAQKLSGEKTNAHGSRETCDACTEQVREPHLNNTHTHTLNLNTLSPTICVLCFEFRVLKVLENTQMFCLVDFNFIDCFMNFCL